MPGCRCCSFFSCFGRGSVTTTPESAVSPELANTRTPQEAGVALNPLDAVALSEDAVSQEAGAAFNPDSTALPEVVPVGTSESRASSRSGLGSIVDSIARCDPQYMGRQQVRVLQAMAERAQHLSPGLGSRSSRSLPSVEGAPPHVFAPLSLPEPPTEQLIQHAVEVYRAAGTGEQLPNEAIQESESGTYLPGYEFEIHSI